MPLFDTIHEIESAPHVTLFGKSKRVSDAIVADAINARGILNFRGKPFSRKAVWEIRRKPAYIRHVADTTGAPLLPQLPPLPSL